MKTCYFYLICVAAILLFPCSSVAQSATSFDSASFFKTFHSKTASVNGIQMHYVVGGKGELIVLIHGWPENWYEWRKVMPLLINRYTVISVDLRGAGQSTVTEKGYDKKNMAADVHALITSLGYKTAIVVGHDWGAGVAYAYAAQYRQEVSRLIVCEGIPFGKWLPNYNLFWFFDFIRTANAYAEQLTNGREKEFLHYFYQRPSAHFTPDGISSADEDYYVRYFRETGRMTAGFNFYRTIDQDVIDNDEWALNPLSVPVLAIGADLQSKDAVEKTMKMIASNVKGIVMQNTGHFAPEDRPQEFVQIVSEFLNSDNP
jgi:pimeloyl-ACP methyl ester carboxylesterase